MRTAIYLRISQDKTGEEAGVNRQREDCLGLAESLSWQVAEIYTDNDLSATSGKPRPEYRRMLSDIESGRIDAIVAWHTDRLYRTMRDIEQLVETVEGHQLAIRTCRSGELDLSTPTGRMLARILGATAQHEVEQKADRWARSVRQRRQAGHWLNSASRMFGYTRDGEIVPEEADVLRRIATDILSGSTIHGVCHWLADEGIKTTRGNDWAPSSLRVTLRSPKIAGLSALNGTIIGPGQWEPILDRDTWEQMVAAIDARKWRNQTPPRRALLSGLVECGVDGCGRRLYRAKRGYMIYRCATELKANGHVAVAADQLERMVEAAAREELSHDNVRRAIAARQSSAGTAAAELTAEIDRIETEIAELSHAMREAGARSKVELARSIDDLDTELQTKRDRLSELSPAQLPAGDRWPTDLDQRAALIRLVVARVVVYPTTVRGRFDTERVRIVPTFTEDEAGG